MQAYQILINGIPTQLGEQLPSSIYNFEVYLQPVHVAVQPGHEPLIKQWLNQIIDNLTTDFVSFNNILIPSSELQRFSL